MGGILSRTGRFRGRLREPVAACRYVAPGRRIHDFVDPAESRQSPGRTATHLAARADLADRDRVALAGIRDRRRLDLGRAGRDPRIVAGRGRCAVVALARRKENADDILKQIGNVRIDEQGDDLIIKIKKTLNLGPSKSGKTNVVGTTHGFVWLTSGIGLSVNVVRK